MEVPVNGEHYTQHQLLLMEIRDQLCGGNAAELARRIGKDATYVNRLFYPDSKPGRKGIGLEIMEACNRAFFLPYSFWQQTPPVLDLEAVELIKHKMNERNQAAHGVDAPPPGALSRWGNLVLLTAGEHLTIIDGKVRTPAVLTARSPQPHYGGEFSTMQPIKAWDHEDELPPGEFVMVPRLEVKLSAGSGSGSSQVDIQFNEAQPQAFRAEWVRQQRLKPRKLAAMTAQGDSMEPTIHDGDSLLIDTSQTTVVDGKVYALYYEGGERVKRLFRVPGGGLRIKSDNIAFETFEMGPDYSGHVRIIGRVVHRSGTGGL